MGAAAAKPGDYNEPVLPEGVLEIRISVYKLQITGSSFVDSIVAGASGAYHSGLVVAGKEWAFGGHDMVRESGVYHTQPELNSDYTFYDRIIMGQVEMSAEAAIAKIKSLGTSAKWAGPTYDLIEHNCNHFASDLCWLLLKKRPPDWINGTADIMAIARRRKKAEEDALASALLEYHQQYGLGSEKQVAASQGQVAENNAPPIPGARAFEDTFTKTFEASIKAGDVRKTRLLKECPANVDSEVLKRRVEQEGLDAAAAAGITAGQVSATAGRAASAARATQPEQGLAAWDRCWQAQSGPLVRAWIQAAVTGELQTTDDSKRAEQVQAALAAAAAAAEAAAAEAAQRAEAEAESRRAVDGSAEAAAAEAAQRAEAEAESRRAVAAAKAAAAAGAESQELAPESAESSEATGGVANPESTQLNPVPHFKGPG